MKSFTVSSESVASFGWRSERKGKMTNVDIFEYVTDAGEVLVKIVTDDNFAGVGAEYAFINHKYPGSSVTMQALLEATVNGVSIMCDELSISVGNEEKRVYFDITDFFGKLDRP